MEDWPGNCYQWYGIFGIEQYIYIYIIYLSIYLMIYCLFIQRHILSYSKASTIQTHLIYIVMKSFHKKQVTLPLPCAGVALSASMAPTQGAAAHAAQDYEWGIVDGSWFSLRHKRGTGCALCTLSPPGATSSFYINTKMYYHDSNPKPLIKKSANIMQWIM